MKVLVLDDAKVIRSLLKLTLETSDFSVSTSDSIEEAFKLASSISFDLIIVDYMLDDNRIGLELIELIREAECQSGVPCIVLSAEQMKEHRLKAQQLGIKAWVKKPFTPVGILDTVNQVLEKSMINNSKLENIDHNSNS